MDDADPLEVHVLHDPKNPKIVKGELFSDIIAFRKVIRHYEVKIGFEFAVGYKIDKTRFIAKCAAKGCPLGEFMLPPFLIRKQYMYILYFFFLCYV